MKKGELMKSEKRILWAFLLNLLFSVFEFFGGIITGSVAILSDAVHDIGDAFGIGTSFFLEKKSKKGPDEVYTYGYARFSVLGSVITTLLLLFGSVAVIASAIGRLIEPVAIDYDGMILFAVVGVGVNLLAALCTRKGGSLNQRAVNLHMLEDVLGWIAVLIGALVMRFTDLTVLDPLLSCAVALFLLFHACKNLSQVLSLFLIKAPNRLNAEELKEKLLAIEGIEDVHHIHVWSLDGQQNVATLHAVVSKDAPRMKAAVRKELAEKGIGHVTVEIEAVGEPCQEISCRIGEITPTQCHHHHHHHH